MKKTVLLTLLLCVALLVACGKEPEKPAESPTSTPAGETTPGATETPAGEPTKADTPTPEPTFGPPEYETAGRDDIFRIPVKELDEGWIPVSWKCAGEYALLWLTTPDDVAEESKVFVLLHPNESTEQRRLTIDYGTYSPILLADGTVVLLDPMAYVYHVYDSTLTEKYTIPFQGSPTTDVIGVSESGLEVAQDPSAQSLSALSLRESDSMWFFYPFMRPQAGFVFPKEGPQEKEEFRQGSVLCSVFERKSGDGSLAHEFRMYDAVKQTKSAALRDSDIGAGVSINACGVAGDGNLLLLTSKDGTRELLMWKSGGLTEPIENFIKLDDSQNELKKNLDALLAKASEGGAVIEYDWESLLEPFEWSEDYVGTLELAYAFIGAAKTNPDVLKTASGDAVHPENFHNNASEKIPFNRHVFSEFYLKQFGEKRRETFFRFVDALYAGEDRFECPNDASEQWCCKLFASYFFPVAEPFISCEYAGDGWAKIIYKEPKEEFLGRIQDFENRVSEILTRVIEEDYTDLEKALALYEYLAEATEYDEWLAEYVASGNDPEDIGDWTSQRYAYRVLMEHRGICSEIAALYQYLLLQCGVDAECCDADAADGGIGHAWNIIRLDGVSYLLDATWAITESYTPRLTFFLFTDDVRVSDGYLPETFDVGMYDFLADRAKTGYAAVDERYKDLWGGRYVAIDESEKCIFFLDGDGVMQKFSYGK